MSIVRDKTKAKLNIKANINRLLHVRGWSVADLVRESREPHQTVYRTARGESVPDAVTLANIADTLDTTIDKLLETPLSEKLQEVA